MAAAIETGAARHRLGVLAEQFGLALRGSPDTLIEGVCTLAPGEPGRISFLGSHRYRAALAATRAGAVIVGARDAEALPGAGLIADDPQLAFARIAALFDHRRRHLPGVHPSAAIDLSAALGDGVAVGPMAVIEAGAVIGEAVFLGPGSIVGAGARIGAGTRVEARAVIGADCRIGERCRIEPGAVIGSRGFGNVLGPAGWEAVPQLGRVVVGDDVEIGAGTTIDRGAIDDTVIENNVRLDNLIQVAHNCRIGAHTAIAACTAIAGSTRIGRRCMIGGAVGISGHLEIADEVVILGRAMVTRSLTKKGVYGSGLPVDEAGEWRKTVARVRRLGRLEERVARLETGRVAGIEGGTEGRLGLTSSEDKNDD